MMEKPIFVPPPQKEVGKVVSLSPRVSHRVLALRRFLEPIGRDQVGGGCTEPQDGPQQNTS